MERPYSDWDWNAEVSVSFETKQQRISMDRRLFGKTSAFWLTPETLWEMVRLLQEEKKLFMDPGDFSAEIIVESYEEVPPIPKKKEKDNVVL